MTKFSVFIPHLWHNTMEQLAREDFVKGLQKYMENKSERNENKINCLMSKIDRDDRNTTQRLYRCGFNYTLSKLIVNNGLGNLWKRENPDSSEVTHYDRSSSTRYRIDRIYTYINVSNKTKINCIIIVSFTDHYKAISLDRLLSKTKIGRG